MPSVYEEAEKWRASLARRDATALRHLVRTFRPSYEKLKAELKALEDLIAAHPGDPRLLAQHAQVARTVDEVAKLIAEHTRSSLRLVTARQLELIRDALRRALALVRLAAPPPLRSALEVNIGVLQRQVATEIVGYLSDGTPFTQLANTLDAAARDELRQALVDSIVRGERAEDRLNRARKALGSSLDRTLRIARTETLRAHREASRRAYVEAGVVDRWRWLSARQPGRTCVVCWMMDGTEHPLTEPLASHPNCRCTMVPVTRSWADLGFPDLEEADPPETGYEAFGKLTTAQQREILGPGAQALYEAGRLDPRDLVGPTRSPVWGPGRRRLPLAVVAHAPPS